MPTEVDWARLAAYIDGEGSIFIRQRKATAGDVRKNQARGHSLVVTIANCDIRLLNWCRENFDGCVYRSRPDSPGVGAKYQRPRRAYFAWIVGNAKAAHMLDKCMPYFICKKEQAEIALAFQKTVSRRNHTRWKGGLPSGLYEEREAFRLELQRLKHVSFPNEQIENEHRSRVRSKKSQAASALLFDDLDTDLIM
jgi:hypothetical protein